MKSQSSHVKSRQLKSTQLNQAVPNFRTPQNTKKVEMVGKVWKGGGEKPKGATNTGSFFDPSFHRGQPSVAKATRQAK